MPQDTRIALFQLAELFAALQATTLTPSSGGFMGAQEGLEDFLAQDQKTLTQANCKDVYGSADTCLHAYLQALRSACS